MLCWVAVCLGLRVGQNPVFVKCIRDVHTVI